MPINEFVYLVVIDETNEGLYAIGTDKSRSLKYFERIGVLEKPIAAVYIGDLMDAIKQAEQFMKQFNKTTWRNAKPMDRQEILKLIS